MAIGVYATNGVIQTSDARHKSKITDLNYGLDDVLKMRPVQFYWKHRDGSPLKLGLIAQELQIIVPEVSRNPDPTNNTGTMTGNEIDPLGIYYSDLIPELIKAIQELEARVRELEGMID